MPESDLIRNGQAGSREACRELLERYAGYAMSVAAHILLNRQDAEDCCQEAFFRAFRNLGALDPERGFKPWFTAVLVRVCLDLRRKRRRFGKALDRLKTEARTAARSAGRADPPGGPGWDDAVLSALAPNERASLFLWAREGATGEEIGAALGCSAATAHVHLFRARTKLRALLKEKNHGLLP